MLEGSLPSIHHLGVLGPHKYGEIYPLVTSYCIHHITMFTCHICTRYIYIYIIIFIYIYNYLYIYIHVYILYIYPLCSLVHCISKAPGRRLDLSSVPIGLADGWPTGTTAQMFVPWARLGASGGRAFVLFGQNIIKYTWPGMSCAKTLRRNCVYVYIYTSTCATIYGSKLGIHIYW